MPITLPVKVSQLMTPLVNVEKTFEQGVAAAGLPVIPGPMSMSQQLVTPAPEELAAAMRIPAAPAPAAPPAAPPAPPAPAVFRPGRRI